MQRLQPHTPIFSELVTVGSVDVVKPVNALVAKRCSFSKSVLLHFNQSLVLVRYKGIGKV